MMVRTGINLLTSVAWHSLISPLKYNYFVLIDETMDYCEIKVQPDFALIQGAHFRVEIKCQPHVSSTFIMSGNYVLDW